MCSDAMSFDGLEQEIIHYLEQHPHAADSCEGITHWWLAKQRFQLVRAQVQKALDQLVDENKLERVSLGGQTIYRKKSD